MAGCHIMSRSRTGAENETVTASPGLISCPDHLHGAENEGVTAWPGVISYVTVTYRG